MKDGTKAGIVIDIIVTHGSAAAANGGTTLNDGMSCAFCHVYRFGASREAGIKAVTEYLIENRGDSPSA